MTKRLDAAMRGALALTAGLFLGVAPVAADPVTVTTDAGPLVGVSQGDVVAFKGVPFAAAPLGALRWAPPQMPAPWSTPRPAVNFGPACPQPLNPSGGPNGGGATGPINEDCLFLNVWAPKAANHAPVMLWLHGGSNLMGAGSLGAYDGSAFARDGVILVSINYRLGILGFYAHPALTKAARPDAPLGAYGIMDQIAALQWVRRNIDKFGGDPANVTLFGESAGGSDALTLLATPSASGLFAKAIVESGGGWSPPATLAKREAQGMALAIQAGAPATASVEQLRALPVAALIALPPGQGGAIIDGRLLTESPTQAFAYGHIPRVPMIIGANSYEASLMTSFHMPVSAALAMAPATVQAAYADQPTDEAKAHWIFTDGIMGAPARWIANKASRSPTWLYHFSYVLDAQRGSVPGAGHATEIPFVFASWDTLGANGLGLKPTANDLAVTAAMHSCWVAFAKSGAPSCAGAPNWPAYTAETDSLMQFDATPSVKTHFRKAQYDAQQTAQLPIMGVGQ